MSGGDVSLAATKFKTFKRFERRVLLGLLENCGNPTEDMLRWKKRWIRLGEKLYAGEYAAKFSRLFEAFDMIPNDKSTRLDRHRFEKIAALEQCS